MSSHPEVFTGGVLCVTVHHVYYPVTEETLQQVFAAYGVVKISVSQRIDHVEAVVQLRSRRGAAQALTLHGRCIYERACHLNIQDVSPEYNLYWCLLLELKQTATVTEYTAAFWEHVHHVLDLNPNLSIKCFVPQYIEGLREDIQPAVQSQSPSSITRASSIARIKEEEIRKDAAMGAEELGDGYDHGVHGLMPSETLSNVSPELAAPVLCGADRGVDASSLAAPTPPTCSTECLSRNATVIDPNSVAIDALSQKMDRLLCMMDKGIARMSSAHEAVMYATRSSSVAASPTTPAYSTPMAIDVPETHVVIGKMPEQNLVILWPPWRRNAFSPGHSAIHSDQLLLANIQSRRRSGFSLGKYGIGGAQHVVDKLPSWRRNAFSPRNSVMQGSPEMWFSFFSQFHMTHFSASKWDSGNRLQFLLLITIYHFLRLEDLACWSAQFSTSWCHMWAWLYRLFSAPDQHTCFSSSPVYMVHSGSSCMCAGAKEQWKALYCVQNWCLCRMECSQQQQHILDWKICNPCPTGFYTRTQFQWTLRDMLPFGKPAMEVNYACVSTIPEWFTCSVGLLDSKLPVFSFLWVMHCTQLHNFSIASLCSQSWYSCCYKKIQIAVIATVCLVLECPKLIAAACYMKVLSWTWTKCEHNLRHLIRNGVEGIDHVGHERQRTHLTGQWDSFLVVVHWNHQEDGSECYFHLQSRLLGLIVQQLCNMSSLEGMPWDPGGIHGSGI